MLCCYRIYCIHVGMFVDDHPCLLCSVHFACEQLIYLLKGGTFFTSPLPELSRMAIPKKINSQKWGKEVPNACSMFAESIIASSRFALRVRLQLSKCCTC